MNTFTELIITPHSMRVKGGDLNFADATRMLLTAQKKIVTDLLDNLHDNPEFEDIRSGLFDTLNVGYGRLLEEIFPDLHNVHIDKDYIEQTIEQENADLEAQAMEARQIDMEDLFNEVEPEE